MHIFTYKSLFYVKHSHPWRPQIQTKHCNPEHVHHFSHGSLARYFAKKSSGPYVTRRLQGRRLAHVLGTPEILDSTWRWMFQKSPFCFSHIGNLPSLKLTVRPWKSLVGSFGRLILLNFHMNFHLWWAIFRGELLVSRRVTVNSDMYPDLIDLGCDGLGSSNLS